MNFKDQWITDQDGKQFIFTVEMQRRLNQADLPVKPESLALLSTESRPQQRSQENKRSHQNHESSSRDSFVAPVDIQIDPQTGKYIGRVKWYNERKGYGFIVRGGGEEIFFHKSSTAKDPLVLEDGQWVLYDVEDTQKGPEATDVEPYEETTLTD